jgi:hypothetical protein
MFLDFIHHPMFFSKNSELFLKDPTEYGAPSFYLKTETDPVSKTFFWKQFWTMDKVHKHDSSKLLRMFDKTKNTATSSKPPKKKQKRYYIYRTINILIGIQSG